MSPAIRLIVLSLASASVFEQGWACDLQCENARLFKKLEQEDGRLNAAYRQLVAALDPAQKSELRQIQRSWIVQRDRLCDGREERWCAESGCTNGYQLTSAANERLHCLVDVTARRSSELRKAIRVKESGVVPDFAFLPLDEKG